MAQVEIGGKIETVHVKNTGRCKELLLLIAVYKTGLGWVNIDSQAPNQVVKEWLESRPVPFNDAELIKSEYTYGKSRVDFYMEAPNRKILMEVKGVPLR